MKNLMLICMAAALPLATFSADKAEDTKKAAAKKTDDRKLFEGTWKPTEATLAGQPLPPPVLKALTLKLAEDKYEVTVAGEGPDQGTWSIDPAKDPKHITITGTNGPNKGKTFPAIYKLDGDKLEVCYDLSGQKRPTEFKSIKDTQLYLVTYKREKK